MRLLCARGGPDSSGLCSKYFVFVSTATNPPGTVAAKIRYHDFSLDV